MMPELLVIFFVCFKQFVSLSPAKEFLAAAWAAVTCRSSAASAHEQDKKHCSEHHCQYVTSHFEQLNLEEWSQTLR